MTRRIFITGAAGYVGGMLCDLFAQRADVERIIALDKAPMPDMLRGQKKMVWVSANTADPSWREIVARECPDLVIHAAWQIREMYGKEALQREWNIAGADRVFDFAFGTPSVKRLVHFSTVASYGAEAGNSIERRFTEGDAFRISDFRYAEEKRIVEQHLALKFGQARERGSEVAVAVLRPAAIAGPRGRRQAGRAGLQSALAGQAKGKAIDRLASLLVSFIPVTPNWCRQFIHEDDVADIVALLAFGELKARYDAFNACPCGDVVRGEDLAQAFRKRPIRVHPQLIRLAFFLIWHATRGRISTARGSWKSYSYPIAVDGSKLTDIYAYQYRMGSMDAFTKNVGRYAVP